MTLRPGSGETTEISRERRHAPRVTPADTAFRSRGLVRPGQEIVLVNISRGGALIHSANHLKPGARTELQLLAHERHVISGRIDRCRVISLNPLRYEGAIVFDGSFRALVDCKSEISSGPFRRNGP